jgi:hypothetical protein
MQSITTVSLAGNWFELFIQPSSDYACFSKLYRDLYNVPLPKNSRNQEQVKLKKQKIKIKKFIF